MNHYECMFVLHNRELPEEEQPAADPEQVARGLVEKVGGEVVHALVWANRKLAYSIKGNQTATYVLAYVSGGSGMISALQHAVSINDRVLRMMALAIDELPATDALPGPLAEPAGRGGRRDAEPEPEPEVPEGEERPKREERERARLARLDYKNVYHLRRMVTAQGKLFSRVRSGMSAKEQRRLREAVLRARTLALLPFVAR